MNGYSMILPKRKKSPRRQILIAKKHDPVPQPCITDRSDDAIIEVLAQVHPSKFGADRSSNGLHLYCRARRQTTSRCMLLR
jgi:hypothetical protein